MLLRYIFVMTRLAPIVTPSSLDLAFAASAWDWPRQLAARAAIQEQPHQQAAHLGQCQRYQGVSTPSLGDAWAARESARRTIRLRGGVATVLWAAP